MTGHGRLQSLLSPEARLLLLAASEGSSDEELRSLLTGTIDWPRLAWLAIAERATSVLWRRLSRVAPDLVQPEFAQTLQRLALMTDFRGAYLRERCDQTLRAFADAGIDTLLLKGAALAYVIYGGDFTARSMGDADVLVSPDRAEDAWRIARETGWEWEADQYPRARYERHHHLPPLSDQRRTGASFELHTRLSPAGHPFSLTLADTVPHSSPVALLGERVRALSPSAQIAHLAVHFIWSHEGLFGGWRCLRDVGAVVAMGDVDWPLTVELATRHRAANCCYWTLRLARNLCGVDVPESVLDSFEVSTPRSLRPVLERHLATQLLPADRICPSVRVRRFMWSLAVRPRQQGCGTLRPWDASDAVVLKTEAGSAVSTRVRSHMGRLTAWWRYLRLVSLASAGPR